MADAGALVVGFVCLWRGYGLAIGALAGALVVGFVCLWRDHSRIWVDYCYRMVYYRLRL